MKRTHRTLDGLFIEYTSSPEIDAFLSRLQAVVDDSSKNRHDFVDLAYSKENPILDRNFHPRRGWVNREAFENPFYRVMGDLLDRKGLGEPPHSSDEERHSTHDRGAVIALARRCIEQGAALASPFRCYLEGGSNYARKRPTTVKRRPRK